MIPVLHPYKGEMLTVTEISRRSGVSRCVLVDRANKYGISIEKAAEMGTTKEVKAKRGLHPYKGEMLDVYEIARRCGVSRTVLQERSRRLGITLEQAADMGRMDSRARYEFDGEYLTMTEIAERTGLTCTVIRDRMVQFNLTAQEAAEYQAEEIQDIPIPVLRIANQCISGARITKNWAGEYEFTMKEYAARIRLNEGKKKAVLTVIFRKSGAKSMEREYRVNGNSVQEVAARSY